MHHKDCECRFCGPKRQPDIRDEHDVVSLQQHEKIARRRVIAAELELAAATAHHNVAKKRLARKEGWLEIERLRRLLAVKEAEVGAISIHDA